MAILLHETATIVWPRHWQWPNFLFRQTRYLFPIINGKKSFHLGWKEKSWKNQFLTWSNKNLFNFNGWFNVYFYSKKRFHCLWCLWCCCLVRGGNLVSIWFSSYLGKIFKLKRKKIMKKFSPTTKHNHLNGCWLLNKDSNVLFIDGLAKCFRP